MSLFCRGSPESWLVLFHAAAAVLLQIVQVCCSKVPVGHRDAPQQAGRGRGKQRGKQAGGRHQKGKGEAPKATVSCQCHLRFLKLRQQQAPGWEG